MSDIVASPEAPEVLRYNLEIKNPSRVFRLIALVFVAIVFLRNTWVGDDSFITMRVVDNFVNGYGLVWNVGERVQVFTSPLWMFLLTLVYALTHDPYVTLYGLSLVVSLVGFWLILKYFSRNSRETSLLTLILVSSAAFVDYSTSGLENPLTHLLLIATLIVTLKWGLVHSKTLFVAALFACLAALNRLDTLLFYLPLLGWLVYAQRAAWLKSLGLVALAFVPLLGWLLFATFYYGFPLPNTYYAKLPTNYALAFFWDRGIAYYLNSLHWDPLTLIVIGVGIVLAAVNREPRKIAIAVGVVLYLLYGLRIGGDFMSGRFISAAFVTMVLVVFDTSFAELLVAVDKRMYWFVVMVVVAIGLSANFPPVLTESTQNAYLLDGDVSNERLYYFSQLALLNHIQNGLPPTLGGEGNSARKVGNSPIVQGTIGAFGFYAGPQIYIIDSLVLSDPLRARLPAPGGERVGHYERPMPEGYPETIADYFQNHLADPDLHAYYDKLSILIHDDLGAPGRLQEIIAFNLGRYDSFLRNYALKVQ